ncbi:Smg-4/UPF3 family-domain-containing protein [Papiliotrema laurentii]|uniref:Smg-4/UPF3 family-domain-containing protein n=1 Tax=Papiliotrema laurentii TaxID=5418 RepID=A0AAD9FNQ4_PAPLA|nr:Smg-4/UPF3 family-domain-containing protein [Papiliotrema laurentii]
MSRPSTSAPRLKLVIRRLPPSLPEDIFWNSVQAWIKPETCVWRRYVKGTDDEARKAFSRAYVLMTNVDDLVAFHRGFDGHIFRSKTGVEFQAVVEFAPYQKTPHKTKVKVDARQGTIEDDSDYKSYLELLAAPAPPPRPEAPIAPPTSTPLLDHLRATKKSKAKAKAKNQTKGQSKEPREAALASVNKAAAKRAPHDNKVTMIAGKGRGVTIAPATTERPEKSDGADSNEKKPKPKKKPRPKGKPNTGSAPTPNTGRAKGVGAKGAAARPAAAATATASAETARIDM